jgi:aminoglycoside 6'-N-acetyltransferase
MVADDLCLLHEWLQRPHVRRWWSEDRHRTLEGVVEHFGPAIDGREPTDHYIAVLDGGPVGMVQTYLVSDYPQYAKLIGIDGAATAGADILIGEGELTGQGLGTEILRRFVSEIVLARPETTACVADPDVDNIASIRAFEKAGFHIVRTFNDPTDGQTHALVRRDRAQGAQSAPR